MDESSRGSSLASQNFTASPKTELPSIFEYIDVSLFLQDYYQYRKAQTRDFSYQSWADELGVTSKSYLRFVTLRKRRISSELLDRLAQMIFQTEAEKDYFTHLVFYSQAESETQKKHFGRQLIKSQREQVRFQVQAPPVQATLAPLAVMVRNVLSFADGEFSESELARIFKVQDEELSGFLNELHRIGWVEMEVNHKNWKATASHIKITDLAGSESLAKYHQESLQQALLQAQNSKSEERSFRSLGMALNEGQYKALLEEWGRFVQGLFEKNESSQIQGKRMYQINFNAIPWTEKIR